MGKSAKILIKNLRELMDKAGWTQAQLADRLEISRTNLGNYLSGKNVPSVDSIEAIAEMFGVTVADLFATDEVPEPKVHVEKTTLPEEIRAAIQTENSKLLNELSSKLLPSLAKLQSEYNVREVEQRNAPHDKFNEFLNRFMKEVSTEFYQLLDTGADDGSLKVEFLRSLNDAVLNAHGPEAKELREALKRLSR